MAKQTKALDQHENALRAAASDDACSRTTAAIDILTNDTLYHIFNGTCSDGALLFPPECRWAPALVCHRWRDVIEAITRADFLAACRGLCDRTRNAVSAKGLHRMVTALGMALMASHGLAPASFGAWTAVQPTVAETAAVLVASDQSDRLGEALDLASCASDEDGWSALGNMLNAALVGMDKRAPKACGTASPKRARRALLWIAARHCSGETVCVIGKDCSRKCTFTAIEHAIRFDRAAAFAVLLKAYNSPSPTKEHETPYTMSRWDTRYNTNVDGIWITVGKWGALSIAETLLEVERSNPLGISDDLKYDLSRKAQYDMDWSGNWIDEGAAINDRPECLDFCHRHDLQYEVMIALGYALRYGSVAFCQRLVGLHSLSAHSQTFCEALRFMFYLYPGQPLHPRTLVWLVDLPGMERAGEYGIDRLWHDAQSFEDADINIWLQMAASVIRRWPDAFYDALSNLPFRQIFPLYRANDPLILRFLETLPADGAEKAKRWWESRVRWF